MLFALVGLHAVGWAETRDFFVDLLGFEVAMDMGWVVTVASPTNPSAQVTIVGNDDMVAPVSAVEVTDVDAAHAKAVEQGFEIRRSTTSRHALPPLRTAAGCPPAIKVRKR